MGTKNAHDKASGGSAGVDSRANTPADPSGSNQGPTIWPDMANPTSRPKESQVVSNPRKKEKRFYIYYLRRPDQEDPFEPGRGCPFYVGKGNNCRAGSHRIEARELLHKPGRKSYKITIIHYLWKQGLDFEEDIFIDSHSEEDAFAIEIAAIEQYGRKDNGTGILANLTDGGEGGSGCIRSDETKEKMRQVKLGENNPQFGKPSWNKGKSPAIETKEKISQALSGENHPNFGKTSGMKGKKHTPEAIEKNRQANLGRASGMKGKKRTPEAIEKSRQFHIGRKRSQKTKERVSEALRGKPKSEEHKEKLRQASLLYWKRKRGEDV